jgi:hypothetical protein
MDTIKYDLWFDEYNDYLRLYEMFGDEEYIKEAERIITRLRKAYSRNRNFQIFIDKLYSKEKSAWSSRVDV